MVTDNFRPVAIRFWILRWDGKKFEIKNEPSKRPVVKSASGTVQQSQQWAFDACPEVDST